MELIKHITSLRSKLHNLRIEEKSLGLVPTMGALHQGHVSLVDTSVKENDVTAASLFVNPAQFNNPEDYKKYPNSIDKDLEIFERAGTDIVFMPSVEEMYPSQSQLAIDFGPIANIMEGKYRPGHFNGVGLIVAKLFNLFKPDRAYFGQKDFQQYFIIRKLNLEFQFGVDIKMLPTIREENGLAMSSRNRRLTESGLEKAAILSRALQEAKVYLEEGKQVEEIKASIKTFFEIESIELEYFEIVNQKDLSVVSEVYPNTELALCIACYVDGVRLIDNTLLTLR